MSFEFNIIRSKNIDSEYKIFGFINMNYLHPGKTGGLENLKGETYRGKVEKDKGGQKCFNSYFQNGSNPARILLKRLQNFYIA